MISSQTADFDIEPKGNLEVLMSKAWIIAGIAFAGLSVTGCAEDSGYYVDAYGQRYDQTRVKCITAPVGYVVPDDVYTAKYGQPWGIRCVAGTIPVVISTGPDGEDVEVPVTPKPPGPPAGKTDDSVFSNTDGAAAIDQYGNVALAGSTIGASANGTKAEDALKNALSIMQSTQQSVYSQVEQDLARN
jgi:hypothetical protein